MGNIGNNGVKRYRYSKTFRFGTSSKRRNNSKKLFSFAKTTKTDRVSVYLGSNRKKYSIVSRTPYLQVKIKRPESHVPTLCTSVPEQVPVGCPTCELRYTSVLGNPFYHPRGSLTSQSGHLRFLILISPFQNLLNSTGLRFPVCRFIKGTVSTDKI